MGSSIELFTTLFVNNSKLPTISPQLPWDFFPLMPSYVSPLKTNFGLEGCHLSLWYVLLQQWTWDDSLSCRLSFKVSTLQPPTFTSLQLSKSFLATDLGLRWAPTCFPPTMLRFLETIFVQIGLYPLETINDNLCPSCSLLFCNF